jgi:hypothetical protein
MDFMSDSLELKTVRQLHREGKIPLAVRVAMALCQRGRFPATKLGGMWYSNEQWVDEWIQKNKTSTAKELV